MKKQFLFSLILAVSPVFAGTIRELNDGATTVTSGSTLLGGSSNSVVITNSSGGLATDTDFTQNGTTLTIRSNFVVGSGAAGLLSVFDAGGNLGFQANGTTATQFWQTLQSPNEMHIRTTSAVNIQLQPNSSTVLDVSTTRVAITGDLTVSQASIVDAYNSSFGAVTAASTSTLTWTEVTDRLNEFVTSSFTVTTAGFYEIRVQAGASQTAGTGCLLLKNNGSTITGGDSCVTGATALATVLDVNMVRILNLAANDIIRVDGSATSANVTFQKMHLTIKRLP